MSLAVLPEYDPLITGLPTMVQVGENALVNCTSDYSLPAATIDWFVDSEPQELRGITPGCFFYWKPITVVMKADVTETLGLKEEPEYNDYCAL
ncbi:unnamed protein product [Arctia plantaginis]|uniref:Ig-like domain-containing protein n=1 Tax=Arctia plantaginis TaxID=874455 RepID=A0A8S1B121_ARCPL|nr:unnamed protein product [Arctia plantaginis]